MNSLEDTATPTVVSQPQRSLARRWTTWLPLLAALVAVFAVRARWFSESSHAAPQNSAPATVVLPAEPPSRPASDQPETPAETQRRMFLGSWRDDYYGERTMTFADDGTGTMVIKLDSVGQAIYGEHLLFNLAWTIRDGVLEMKFVGGEPKTAVQTISKLWGDTHLQAIEVLTETELHLRSTDSQNLYTLQRLPKQSM